MTITDPETGHAGKQAHAPSLSCKRDRLIVIPSCPAGATSEKVFCNNLIRTIFVINLSRDFDVHLLLDHPKADLFLIPPSNASTTCLTQISRPLAHNNQRKK